MALLGPVSIHHTSWFTPYLSAYFFNAATESLSGSTVNERKCTKGVSTRLRSSLSFNDCCSFFIFRVSVGQMEGQCVKKKSATMILPLISSRETLLPSWLYNVRLCTLLQMVSVVSFPFCT